MNELFQFMMIRLGGSRQPCTNFSQESTEAAQQHRAKWDFERLEKYFHSCEHLSYHHRAEMREKEETRGIFE